MHVLPYFNNNPCGAGISRCIHLMQHTPLRTNDSVGRLAGYCSDVAYYHKKLLDGGDYVVLNLLYRYIYVELSCRVRMTMDLSFQPTQRLPHELLTQNSTMPLRVRCGDKHQSTTFNTQTSGLHALKYMKYILDRHTVFMRVNCLHYLLLSHCCPYLFASEITADEHQYSANAWGNSSCVEGAAVVPKVYITFENTLSSVLAVCDASRCWSRNCISTTYNISTIRRGCPNNCFSTPHVKLFNFDPPDRGGGIWHRPLPQTPY